MPVSAPDLALFRDSLTHTINPTFNVVSPTVVATATVSVTPTTYPIGSVTVSGTSAGWNNIEVGMLFRIKDVSGNHVTWGVVRLAPTSNTFYFDGKSKGDAGIATNIIRAIQATDILTVYDVKPLWTLLSRIKDGIFYKKFDVPYDGSGSTPAPVVNMGSHKSVLVNSGSVYTLDLDGTSSFAWGAATITSYLWSFPETAGYTITSGTVNSSTLTVDFDEGYHKVKLTVTDSNGKSATGERHIFVNSEQSPDLSRVASVNITGDSQDTKGRTLNVTINGDVDESVFLEGSLFVVGINPRFVSENPIIGSQTMNNEYIVDTIVGFVSEVSLTLDDGDEKQISFSVESPFSFLDKIPMVSQVIVEVASPNSWEEVITGLGTIDFLVWYILYHHCTFLTQFDYSRSGDGASSPRHIAWGLNANTVAQHLETIASYLGAGNIGCTSDGTLMMRRTPMLEGNTFRDALDVIMEWTDDDFEKSPDVTYAYLNSVAQVRLYGLVRNTSSPDGINAYGSIAPGQQQGQANGSEQYENIALRTGEGQDRVNEMSGHFYAMANRQIDSLEFTVMRYMDVFEPAKMLWHLITIPATYNARNREILTRALVTSVSRSWEFANDATMTISINPSFQPETFGQLGVTLPMETGGGGPEVTTIVEPPNIYEKKPENIITEFVQSGFLIAVDTDGNIGRSFDGNTWQRINNGVSNFAAVAFDYNPERSTLIQNNYQSGRLGMWAVVVNNPDVNTGKDVYVYYAPDVANASELPEWSLETSQVYLNPVKVAICAANDSAGDDIVVAVNDSRGTALIVTRNGGTSWSAIRIGVETDLLGTPAENAVIAITNLDSTDTFVTSAYDGTSYDIYATISSLITSASNWRKHNAFSYDRPANNIQWKFDIPNDELPVGYISWEANEVPVNYEGYLIPYAYYFSTLDIPDFRSFLVYTVEELDPYFGFYPNIFIEPTLPNLLSEDIWDVFTVYPSNQYYSSGAFSFDGTTQDDYLIGDNTFSYTIPDGSIIEWDNAGLIAGDTYEAGIKFKAGYVYGNFFHSFFIKLEVNPTDAANPALANCDLNMRFELYDWKDNLIDYYEVQYDGVSTSIGDTVIFNTQDQSAIGIMKAVNWHEVPVKGVKKFRFYLTSNGDGAGFFPRFRLREHPSIINPSSPPVYYYVKDFTMVVKYYAYGTRNEVGMGIRNISGQVGLYEERGVLGTYELAGDEGQFDDDGYRKENGGLPESEEMYLGFPYPEANENGFSYVFEAETLFSVGNPARFQEYFPMPNHHVRSVTTDITKRTLLSNYALADICDTNFFVNAIHSGFRLDAGESGSFTVEFVRPTVANQFSVTFTAYSTDPMCAGWSASDMEAMVELLDKNDNVLDTLRWQFYITPVTGVYNGHQQSVIFDNSDFAIAEKLANPADPRISIMPTYDWNVEPPICDKFRMTVYNNSGIKVNLFYIEWEGAPYLGEAIDTEPTPKLFKFLSGDTIYTFDKEEITPTIRLNDNGLYTEPRKIGNTNALALSADQSDGNVYNAIMSDPQREAYYYVKARDRGADYGIEILSNTTSEENLEYDVNNLRSIVQSGNLALVWGVGNMGFIINRAAQSFTSVVGNWYDTVNSSTSEWRQVAAIF